MRRHSTFSKQPLNVHSAAITFGPRLPWVVMKATVVVNCRNASSTLFDVDMSSATLEELPA